MRKVKEYKIIWADSVDVFERLVNEKMTEGWELYGCVHHDSGRWHQAIVKYE